MWLLREKESLVAPGVQLRDGEDDGAIGQEISGTRVEQV